MAHSKHLDPPKVGLKKNLEILVKFTVQKPKFIKIMRPALAGVVQWIDCWPVNVKSQV